MMKKMKRVLIVDDAAFVRLTIRTMLEKNGYEVVGEANDGNVAVSKYMELRPDFMTLDITMPNMDGIETLKAIRNLDKNAVVIMVSALGQERYIKDAVINGAKYFLVKPFKEENVIETIQKIVGA
ncbi:MAG: response regulator [Massilibacillus sp.]|jgi:two-component system chemotaxis response regulator CheY|nr:response regulator [Massilibacillus sp.]